MSDLIKRLQSWSEVTDGEDGLSRARAEREAADRIEALEREKAELVAKLQAMRAAFHVNMYRAFPGKSHDEISAEIDRALAAAPGAADQGGR